jgi:hypothetical protein
MRSLAGSHCLLRIVGRYAQAAWITTAVAGLGSRQLINPNAKPNDVVKLLFFQLCMDQKIWYDTTRLARCYDQSLMEIKFL